MKLVVQRCKQCEVIVNKKVVGNISGGFLALLGIGKSDTIKDVEYLAKKLATLRIFEDANGKMNLDASQVGAELLIVSNFTLYGTTKGTNRPDFFDAMMPSGAEILYNKFIDECNKYSFKKIQTGIFGAEMQVNLQGDGPVTILMESK